MPFVESTCDDCGHETWMHHTSEGRGCIDNACKCMTTGNCECREALGGCAMDEEPYAVSAAVKRQWRERGGVAP